MAGSKQSRGKSKEATPFDLILCGLFLLGAAAVIVAQAGDPISGVLWGGLSALAGLASFFAALAKHRRGRRPALPAQDRNGVPSEVPGPASLEIAPSPPPSDPLRIEIYDRTRLPPATEAGRRMSDAVVRAYRRGTAAAALRVAVVLGACTIAALGSEGLAGAGALVLLVPSWAGVFVYGRVRRSPSSSVVGGWWLLELAVLLTSLVLAGSAALSLTRVAATGPAVALAVLVAGWIAYGVLLRRALPTTHRPGGLSRPYRLLVLWSFDPEAGDTMTSLYQWILRSWRMIGTVWQLRGPGWRAVELGDTVRWVSGRGGRGRINSPARVEARVRYLRTRSASPLGVPTHSQDYLTCADDTWRLAVRRLLSEADVVVMDLRAFDADSRGCAYELGQLMDRMPLQSFILAVDDSTDMAHLTRVLEDRWGRMAVDSPNRRANAGAVRLYRFSRTLADFTPDEDLKWDAQVFGISLNPRSRSSLGRANYQLRGGTDAKGFAHLLHEAAGARTTQSGQDLDQDYSTIREAAVEAT